MLKDNIVTEFLFPSTGKAFLNSGSEAGEEVDVTFLFPSNGTAFLNFHRLIDGDGGMP